VKPKFNFENSKAEFFVDEQGHKVRIYSRDCGKSPLVHGAYLMKGHWIIGNYTLEGKPVYDPLGYLIVGEWKEPPHPAESWPREKIVEVRNGAGVEWVLRRFYSYRLEEPHFSCFREGRNKGLILNWNFIREPE